MSTQIESLYFIHREQVRHSLHVMTKIAEHSRDKGEHPTIQQAGQLAHEACAEADKKLREADKQFREIGLERKVLV